ncbi:MAG TPA: lytic transglycosylase domain-containing protein, partial [Acidobacteriota bacterium]|nr:lytic transglycosylase domain-containing protein [Acidobacteriota bacterium]
AAWRAVLSAAAAPAAGPAARDLARLRLARRCLAEGTPRLAAALLENPGSGAHALLRGEALAAAGDTVAALESFVEYGARSRAPVSERYPALRRAADWAAPFANRLGESSHADLCRALGEVGESDRAIPLLRARTLPPIGAGADLARAELDASLLARARRFDEAIAAYRALGARPSLPEGAAARSACALARASRGERSFATMDSAFVAAARLDREGSIADRAAWERAREWEDTREAREAAAIFAWADSAIRSPDLKAVARVHEALSWKRAGLPDSARAAVAGAPASDPIGVFWRARFSLEAGDTTAAVRDFALAARLAPVSYEGVRAREESARIGRPIPVAEPTEAAPAEGVAAARDDSDARALEIRLLEALGWSETAADRRRRCAREAEPDRARACMDALEEAGVFRVGQRSLVPDARFDYPPAYPGDVMSAAAAESLPPALLWAIMRQESAYDRSARSKAGALGLLQLLPSTASQVAGRRISEDSLTGAALNVRLGARYVKTLLKEFGDLRAVLASYNAGEDAVRRWNRDRGAVDDEWVERIPYRETRDYVKQVYLGWRMYEAIYRVRGDANRGGIGIDRGVKEKDGTAPAP